MAINCAAIPENLLESELFGYEKGAFTGAAKQTKGKVELAHGGTFFLDEVGDLPMALQAKLLRFLQERVIERVGGHEEIPVDVRIVCATHQKLEGTVQHRALPRRLVLPPVRNRRDDSAAAQPRRAMRPCWRTISRTSSAPRKSRPTLHFCAGRDRGDRRLRLAGQCARDGKLHQARRHHGRRPAHRGR